MKKRLLYLAALFGAFLLIFAVQKPAFMLYNQIYSPDCSAGDYLSVMLHGLKLDNVMAGYLTLLPFTGIVFSIWFYRINLRKIFAAYYILAALLVAIFFVVDMALYGFWNFKLDATVVFYMESPANAMASAPIGFLVIRLLLILLLAFLYFVLLRKLTPS
ncbi:MAG: LTA synthase family protein, partial [Candidatus Symbiothrix sp.]|nr:LTA synthase family protein [Candidatus Symbiothrix sp.]